MDYSRNLIDKRKLRKALTDQRSTKNVRFLEVRNKILIFYTVTDRNEFQKELQVYSKYFT